MKRNMFGIFLLAFSILLFVGSGEVSAQKHGQGGGGGSDSVTETATNYTVTKDTITLAGHVVVTTIEFVTFTAGSALFGDADGDTVKIQPSTLYPIWYGDGATMLFSADSTGKGIFESNFTINPVVADQETPTLVIGTDFDTDGGVVADRTLTIQGVGSGNPNSGYYSFTIASGTGDNAFRFYSGASKMELQPTNGIIAGNTLNDQIDFNAAHWSTGSVDISILPDIGAAGNLTVGTPGEGDSLIVNGRLRFTGYTRHIDIEVGAASVGSTAPTATTVGTARGLGFAADAELAHFEEEIPSDWNGTSNFTLVVHWFPTSGDAVANGETVKFDATYRSIATGEAVDNGTVVVATATFTGGGSETDKEVYETLITIAYTGGNQPLTATDKLFVQFDRDVTGDSYSGSAIVTTWELVYTSNTLAAH